MPYGGTNQFTITTTHGEEPEKNAHAMWTTHTIDYNSNLLGKRACPRPQLIDPAPHQISLPSSGGGDAAGVAPGTYS